MGKLTKSDCNFIRLKGVNGAQINHKGLIWVSVIIGHAKIVYPFLIIDENYCDVILGWDFLKRTESYFSQDRKILRSPHFGDVEIHDFIDPNLLKILEKVTIEQIKPQQNPDYFSSSRQQDVQEEPIYATIKSIRPSNSLSWYLRNNRKLVIEAGGHKLVPINTLGLDLSKKPLIKPSKRLFLRTGLTFPDTIIENGTENVEIWNSSIHKRTMNIGTKLGFLEKYVDAEELKTDTNQLQTKTLDIQVNSTQSQTNEDYFQEYDNLFDVSRNVPVEIKHNLFRLIHDFKDIFAFTPGEIGRVTKVKAHIDVGDNEPSVDKGFPKSAKENQIINEKVKDLLARGIIEPSSSPWVSYPFLVLNVKPDGTRTHRMVLNYKKLNERTRKMAYPMPNITDIIHDLRGSKYITTMDFCDAFYQIKLEDSSKEYTSFTCELGLYQFRFCPFGLCNLPAIFAKTVQTMLEPMDPEKRKHTKHYVDDIICFSNDLQQHLGILKDVFTQIRNFGFLISPKKCSFFAAQLRVLGHTTDADGTQISPRQTQAILSLPAPRTRKECRSILGSFNFFRKYLKSFSSIAKPIEKLLCIDPNKKRFQWTDEAQVALDTLKKLVSNPPILSHFRPGTTPALLEADSSLLGFGCALFQEQDGQIKPIAFASRRANTTESKYAPTLLELVGLCFAIKKFRHLIWMEEIIIFTDHKPLVSLVKSTKDDFMLPAQMVRCLIFLRNHNVTVKYKAGKSLELVDTLSRFPDEPAPETDADNINIVKIQSYHIGAETEQIPNSVDSPLGIISRIVSIENDKLLQAQQRCHETQRIKQLVVNRENKGRLKHCFIENDILLYNRRDKGVTVAFLPISLRLLILEEAHDSKISGHNGAYKTLQCISSRYFWPQIKKHTYHFVLSCHDCQLMKASRQKPGGLYQFSEVPCRPFSSLQVDIQGPFNRSIKGYKFIATANCVFSKYLVMGPLRENTAEELAEFLLTKVFLVFGMPDEIKSDQGSNLISKLTAEMMKLLGITHKFGTVAYAAGLGVTERSHDYISARLRTFSKSNPKNWCRFLPFIAYSFNTSVSASTKMSPFMSLLGYDSILPSDLSFGPHRYGYLNEVNNCFEIARDITQQNVLQAQYQAEKVLNKRRRELSFEIGQEVLILRMGRKKNVSKKLLPYFEGPVKIIGKGNAPVLYLVQQVKGRRKQSFMCHVSKLKPYIRRDMTIYGLSNNGHQSNDVEVNTYKTRKSPVNEPSHVNSDENDGDTENSDPESENAEHEIRTPRKSRRHDIIEVTRTHDTAQSRKHFMPPTRQVQPVHKLVQDVYEGMPTLSPQFSREEQEEQSKYFNPRNTEPELPFSDNILEESDTEHFLQGSPTPHHQYNLRKRNH